MDKLNQQFLNQQAQEKARLRWNSIAKPLHSLGSLEDLIVQIAGIQETDQVQLKKRCVLVFCGDHGVVDEGVTQSGSEVTALVARSIAEGTANVNLMARAVQMDVFAVDMGIGQDVPGTIDGKIAFGTQNIAQGPAMPRSHAEKAIQRGIDLVGEMKEKGYRIIATGEMGIGNTTAASAMACALLESLPEKMTGRGAGLSDAGLARKMAVIRRALEINQPDPQDPVDVLAKVGGYEIAGMVGAFLGGMIHRTPIIIDGVIAQTAALAAARLCPQARHFMLPSHMSREPAGRILVNELGFAPIVNAGMALGEGTGAVTLIPLLEMALAVYEGPHTFEDLGMEA
ncbi:MAG: nicotinate-nucleotide--dimethylbenzimidazole phosphoribosyltransferase, partial [Clostridia bacterium]|nr:nicotinate-nucleotide--dimethylbenzimidazole phosphoribosyltransferase [Clostridia bacterium]